MQCALVHESPIAPARPAKHRDIRSNHVMTTAAVPTTRRRVRRIVRKFDPWTVLKVSLIFFGIVSLGIVLLSIIAWTIIGNAGILEKINEVARNIISDLHRMGCEL